MKIISWNTNGLRATYKSGQWDKLLKLNPDIICLQETKAKADQLADDLRAPKKYHAHFHASETKKGYSGVAIYSKLKPTKVLNGLPNKWQKLDREGRTITLHFPTFILVSCYFPNGGSGPDRLEYKLDFYTAFLKYVNLLKKEGLPVIWCGDINTAHKEIDLARPKANETNTGFLPIERAWIDEVIAEGWKDVYRELNPTKADSYTYWDQKTRARDRNVGWRIDYFFIQDEYIHLIKNLEHLVSFMGSDHCPLRLTISL